MVKKSIKKKLISFFAVLAIVLFFIWKGFLLKPSFTNQEYEKQILIEAYLFNKHQLVRLFSDDEMLQNNRAILLGEKLYLVISFKNIGDRAAWGILSCNVEGNNVEVRVPHLGRRMEEYAHFVIPYFGFLAGEEKLLPKISVEWSDLQTK